MLKFQKQIKIKALNLAQIFEELRKKGITIYNLRKGPDFEADFVISCKHMALTKKILQKFDAQILEEQNLGAAKIRQLVFAHFFVFIALFVSGLGGFCASFYILKVDIRGTDMLTNTQIISFLQEKNIGVLKPKSSVQNQVLELDLLQNFSEISLVSVMLKGTTLVINIKEKENFLPQTQGDIVADFCGRITGLTLISGTANVKPGDIVKEGDVLVTAQTQLLGSVEAKAHITAEVWLESGACHYDKQIQSVRTGNFVVEKNILFCGLSVYSTKPNTAFKKFETETFVSKLKNTILPLTIQSAKKYELKEVEVETKFETVKNDIVANCKENALQKVLADDIIKEEKVVISEGPGFTRVNYVVVVERQIK